VSDQGFGAAQDLQQEEFEGSLGTRRAAQRVCAHAADALRHTQYRLVRLWRCGVVVLVLPRFEEGCCFEEGCEHPVDSGVGQGVAPERRREQPVKIPYSEIFEPYSRVCPGTLPDGHILRVSL